MGRQAYLTSAMVTIRQSFENKRKPEIATKLKNIDQKREILMPPHLNIGLRYWS
jgi:hypothetical protein